MSKRKSDTSASSSKRVKVEDEVEVVSGPPSTPSQSTQPARPASPPPPPQRPVEARTVSLRKESKTFNDPEADFEIISRDGISIRVQSYMLLAHSSRFRSLLVGPNVQNPFHMRSDTAKTLEDLLPIMHGKPLWSFIDHRRLFDLIEAAQRLDCPVVLQHIKAKIRESLGQNDINPFHLFIAGARLGCAETCRRAIPHAGKRSWNEWSDGKKKGRGGLKDRVPGHCVLDIRAMPEDTIATIPNRYFTALGRAMLLREGMRPGREDWEEIASEFYRLLTE